MSRQKVGIPADADLYIFIVCINNRVYLKTNDKYGIAFNPNVSSEAGFMQESDQPYQHTCEGLFYRAKREFLFFPALWRQPSQGCLIAAGVTAF